MMDILMNILYILLFVVCLSVLIMLHELGHFTAAKIFKVYVQEYSIGFGPALIHKKPKNGETYFSLRIIPFGGYVAMYGEGTQLEEGVEVDESRSLEGIKHWKRAIIMAAGVTMNAILALHLFFLNNVAFPSETCYYANMTIAEGSKAEAAGLKTLDIIALDSEITETKNVYGGDLHIFDNETVVTTTSGTETVYSYIDLSNFKNYKNLQLSKFLVFYHIAEDGSRGNAVDMGATFKSALINIKTWTNIQNDKERTHELENHQVLVEKDTTGAIEDFGYSLYLDVRAPLSFGKAIVQSFVDFGNSSTLIFRTLGTMFTKESWNAMGGIVAVGFETTSVLQNFGWGKFIYIWGALSVNLAIINLLPFPGLDGWQLLVLVIEGTTKKKIPNKVKTIVSIVGLALLFTFMGVLLFKDVFRYIIPH